MATTSLNHGPDTHRPALTVTAALLVTVIAAVHLEQYIDFISLVPTIGVLFLLNAAGGAGLAVALVSREAIVRGAAALGSIGLAIGSLVSIFLALGGGVFGYQEPSLRLPILIAIVAETAALPLLAYIAVGYARKIRATVHKEPSRVDTSPRPGA